MDLFLKSNLTLYTAMCKKTGRSLSRMWQKRYVFSSWSRSYDTYPLTMGLRFLPKWYCRFGPRPIPGYFDPIVTVDTGPVNVLLSDPESIISYFFAHTVAADYFPSCRGWEILRSTCLYVCPSVSLSAGMSQQDLSCRRQRRHASIRLFVICSTVMVQFVS